ncbi:MAG TPA: tetratricopeptide repeat protein [Burkholderiaceae bacterium]|nr:tetratricopeptide repeat protein [Burkholderiaceae bacterium]
MKAAGDLYRAGKYRDALAKVREADSVPNRTAAEQITIERMRGSAALAAGDNETAVRAFERALASGKVSAGEQAKIAEALAGAEYRAGHYAKAIQWARQASASPAMRQLIIQSSFQMGDYASVVRETAAEVQADEQAGRRPSDDKLHLLASAYQRMNNSAGYAQTVEKLLAYYPKKEYWLDLLARLPRKPGFSDRLSLDVYRLQLATGNMTKPSDYMEAAQLALQAGLATEGRQIVEKGFGSGVLGTGPEAERQKRLRELAIKQESEAKANLPKERAEAETAKDGNGLIKVGYAYVTMGQVDQGIELIEKGLAKGGLKRPEDAKLRLGLAQLQSPKTKAKAAQTLRSVQGNDGTADIARLWAIYANQPHS